MPHGTPTMSPTTTRARNATALSTPKCTMSGRGDRAGRASGAGGGLGSVVTSWSAYCSSGPDPSSPVTSAEHDQAGLGHLVDRVVRAFPGVAAVSHAAVGHLVGAPGGNLVHQHAAEVELPRGAEREREITREDRSLQPVAGVVGEAEGVVDVAVGLDG